MTKIIDGKKIAEKIKDDVCKKIFAIKGARPNLAIILVGKNPESELYVNLKEKEAKKVGIDTHLYKFEKDDQETNILATIDFLNKDNLIDGILIQLPLPKKFNTNKIISKINTKKDVELADTEISYVHSGSAFLVDITLKLITGVFSTLSVPPV
jgi:methylenetetrahydrofolate dehydrogenase (NADP+)/methenyltetrahydrofolate cyclohydrolase